jgi:hypothetical protein
VKPPHVIIVGPYRYSVETDAAAVLELLAAGDHADCNHRMQRIRLDLGQAPGMARDSLLHEVLHACNNASGLNADLNDDQEESLVRRTATVLLEVLRRNPRLVAYLTEGG